MNTRARNTVGRILVLLAAMATLVVGLPTTAQAQNNGGDNNVQATAMAGGYVVSAMVKTDGRLYTREYAPNAGTWGSFIKHGSADDWLNVDIALDDAGNAILVATKENGSLWTRTSSAPDVWDAWLSHGSPNWSTTAAPAVSMASNGSTDASAVAVIAAVKAGGSMYTREWAAGNWSGFVKQGGSGWANTDVVITEGANPEVHVVGVKTAGAMYSRGKAMSASTWSGWTKHGASTWANDTPPSIAAKTGATIVVAAVKTDGRLYTRLATNGSWGGFVRHGAAGWASASVGVDENNLVALLATKNFGGMYLRLGQDGTWVDFVKIGASNWATEQPSIASDRNRLSILGVKANGDLYTRDWDTQNDFGSWTRQGAGSWAR